jgi:hypothetical protein
MRALLTSGIKAILAVAALSTAAHWALRVQREAATPAVSVAKSSDPVARAPDPVVTGSVEPRQAVRPAPAVAGAALAGSTAAQPVPAPVSGLDQTHLAALIAGTAPPKGKIAKAATRTASAERAPPTERAPTVEKVAARR